MRVSRGGGVGRMYIIKKFERTALEADVCQEVKVTSRWPQAVRLCLTTAEAKVVRGQSGLSDVAVWAAFGIVDNGVDKAA